jgi:uncharacterized membrane protein
LKRKQSRTQSLSLAIVAIPLLVVVGCGTALESFDCPDEGTSLTYKNFGRAFLAAHCNKCHAADSSDRDGAPIAIVFDTHQQAQSLASRIFLRSAADNTSMPPGPDDPTDVERYDLAEWVACGMPEDSAEVGSEPGAGP